MNFLPDPQELMMRVMSLIPLMLFLSVHEFAHAWSAWKLGDDTAAAQGRMTLNPIVHIDPIGTLLVPLLFPYGIAWAKPVPVVPARFRRDVSMATGTIITSAAGPLSNVLLAIAGAIFLGLTMRWAPDTLVANRGLMEFLGRMVIMNVGLALFNMLPVPPLDGSRVVDGLLPYRWRGTWEQFLVAGPFLLMALFLFGGGLIAGPQYDLSRWLIRLLAPSQF